MNKDVKFSILKGLTLKSVEVNEEKDQITFTSDCGRVFSMFHYQDCCESVYVESIVGELADLVGSPILIAEESTSSDENPEGVAVPEYQDDSFTWTFYKLATIKGYVDIRWYGDSNGYYSEDVSFQEKGEVK